MSEGRWPELGQQHQPSPCPWPVSPSVVVSGSDASPRITLALIKLQPICPPTCPQATWRGRRQHTERSHMAPWLLDLKAGSLLPRWRETFSPSAQPQASLQRSMKPQGGTLKFCCQALQCTSKDVQVGGGGGSGRGSVSLRLCRGHSRACTHPL